MKVKNEKGFSLIELIIAVAILVVLSGLLAPQLIKYVERSRESKDVQTLDSVYTAINTALSNEKAYTSYINMYSGNYDGKLSGLVMKGTATPDDDRGSIFSEEVLSILGKEDVSDIKLISKRARRDTGDNIYVCINNTKEINGITELEVGVYAGTGKGAPVDSEHFRVGAVTTSTSGT